MAVLVEAISVIVKVDALRRSYPGGWEGYRDASPNQTFCSDPEITRIGFMRPDETLHHVTSLERYGLTYKAGGEGHAINLVVVDQQRGPMVECPWIEFGHIPMGPSGEPVAACRLAGSRITVLITPERWTYEQSLSKSFHFVKTQDVDRRMALLRVQDGLSHWVNRRTGEDYFGSAPLDTESA